MSYGVFASSFGTNQSLYTNNVSKPISSSNSKDIQVFSSDIKTNSGNTTSSVNNNDNSELETKCKEVQSNNQMILDKVADVIPQRVNEKLISESILNAMNTNDNIPILNGLPIEISETGVNGGSIKPQNIVFSTDDVKFELKCEDEVQTGTQTGIQNRKCSTSKTTSIKFDNKIKAKVKETALNYTVSKYLGHLAALKKTGQSCVLEWVYKPLMGDIPVVTATKSDDGYKITFDKQSIKTTFTFTNEEINKVSNNKLEQNQNSIEKTENFGASEIELPKNLFNQSVD